ncbi:MAG TPA: thiol:disulfide interchange protein DsbA/DsbL [Burkholderiaceae bacterium]|nr:thiol:disulfide interchange protein DsbA/DsbL [Burkholderiaceae bacterium]
MKHPVRSAVSRAAAAPIDENTRLLLKAGLAVAVCAAAGIALRPAHAQGRPLTEGTEYRAIKPPQVPEDKSRIEVIEFFWYGCPHCSALEPALTAWAAKLPPDVAYRKVHVPFNEVKHQQLFYALETMGKADDATNAKVFAAIHTERNRMDTVDKMASYLEKHGIDRKAFTEAFESFSVQTKMRKATALAAAYKIDSVPMLAVNGKYLTSPSQAGSNGNALVVADALIDGERKARK